HRSGRDGDGAAHRRATRGAGGPVLLAHHPVPAPVPHHAAAGGGKRSRLALPRVDSDRRRPPRELVHLVASDARADRRRAGRVPPPGLDPASYRVRPASVLLPKEAPWV